MHQGDILCVKPLKEEGMVATASKDGSLKVGRCLVTSDLGGGEELGAVRDDGGAEETDEAASARRAEPPGDLKN